MIINIISVLAILSQGFVALFVYLKQRNSVTNVSFALLSLSLIAWSFTNNVAISVVQNNSTLPIIRLVIFFVICEVASFFVFALHFPSSHLKVKGKYIIGYAVISLLVGIFVLTPAVFSSVSVVNGQANPNPAPGIVIFILYVLASLIFSFYVLFRRYFRSNGSLRQQMIYILMGSVLLFTVVPFTNFVLTLVLQTTIFVRLSPIYILAFSSLMAYAIISKKLFDVRLAVARSVTYILSVGTIALVYGLLAFLLIARVLPQNTSITTLQLIYTVLAVVLAFTFVPIRHFFEKISNAIFYRDHYDSQELINEVGRILASEIDLEKLCHKITHELVKSMKLNFADIVVFSKKEVHFQTKVFSDEHHEILINDLRKLGRLAVVVDEISGGERKDVMQKYDFRVSLALRTKEEFIGYLLLGEKKNGDIYSTEDLRTLKIIANELSVAVQNAKAFTEIQLFNVTLQEKVDLATKKLRRANDELKDLDKAKDEFISMASHQLRTPLTTVKGYASMLEEGDFGKLSKDQKDTVELTLDGANRMTRLIDDLLNVSRMDANRFFLEADKVDIAKLVTEELGQLKTLAESKQIDLTYNAPKHKIPIILLDENKTRQVVMNITDNAIHYSSPPSGGGHVHVSLELKGDHIEYLVQDDGIGVPVEAQKHLFTKMFRAQNARGVRPDGTGLGLYLVKRVVEEQGGEIIFHSEPGKGSTFGFKLPLSGIPKEVLEQSKKIGARVAAHPK